MRLATWNVNSLRARIDRVEAFCARHEVDVLALQETKGREDQLPVMGLQAMGYEVAAAGIDQWNGVALASRVGLEDVRTTFPGQPEWGDPPVVEARALGAVCGGVAVWSLYVPNGRKPDDPHYAYKLDWLARLREAARNWLDGETALMGDWNVAPTDEDVFDIDRFAGATHVTPAEREAFAAFAENGWREVTRAHDSRFTYWDYFQKRSRYYRDRGQKIDFCLASPALAARVRGAFVDVEERFTEPGASDHAPALVDV